MTALDPLPHQNAAPQRTAALQRTYAKRGYANKQALVAKGWLYSCTENRRRQPMSKQIANQHGSARMWAIQLYSWLARVYPLQYPLHANTQAHAHTHTDTHTRCTHTHIHTRYQRIHRYTHTHIHRHMPHPQTKPRARVQMDRVWGPEPCDANNSHKTNNLSGHLDNVCVSTTLAV